MPAKKATSKPATKSKVKPQKSTKTKSKPRAKPKTAVRPVPLSTLTGVALVGDIAGHVWHYLDQQGTTTLTQLAKEVDAPRDQLMQAVGWLAREGKLDIHENGRSRTVSLVGN